MRKLSKSRFELIFNFWKNISHKIWRKKWAIHENNPNISCAHFSSHAFSYFVPSLHYPSPKLFSHQTTSTTWVELSWGGSSFMVYFVSWVHYYSTGGGSEHRILERINAAFWVNAILYFGYSTTGLNRIRCSELFCFLYKFYHK